MAEIIRLPFGIPGVGRKGDRIISDPEHPDPDFRLAIFSTLDPSLLLAIKERITSHPPEAYGESEEPSRGNPRS